MVISNINYFLNVLIIVDFTTNLATGKFAEMSSRLNYYYPVSAVDGSYRTIWYNQCAVTKNNTVGSWWKVDLDAVYDIKMVMLLSRKHCCGETETLTLCTIQFMYVLENRALVASPFSRYPLSRYVALSQLQKNIYV